MKYNYIESELKEFFGEALELFNSKLEPEIDPAHTVLAFFHSGNCASVYETFCSQYFPTYLSEPYQEPCYFDDIGAMAFVNGSMNGVLLRTDIRLPRHEILQIYLHELSHIFCLRNELDGGDFFDRYCCGSGPEDGMINAGYAIWREAIADIMADAILSEYTATSLVSMRRSIMKWYQSIDYRNPASKKAMSLIIVAVMVSREVAGTEDWTVAISAIRNALPLDNKLLLSILELVFRNLHISPFWEITPDFITELGCLYLTFLSGKVLQDRIT